MNDRSDRELTALYERLPKAESPKHLDALILAKARQRVPVPVTRKLAGWLPALVTACVAGVVFTFTPLLRESTIAPGAPVADYEDRLQPEKPTMSLAKPERESRRTMESDAAVSAEVAKSVAGAPSPSPVATTTSATASRARSSVSQAASQADRSKPFLSAEEVAHRLKKIRDLAARQLDREAQRLLDELVARCADCDLPKTLAALEQADTEETD